MILEIKNCPEHQQNQGLRMRQVKLPWVIAIKYCWEFFSLFHHLWISKGTFYLIQGALTRNSTKSRTPDENLCLHLRRTSSACRPATIWFMTRGLEHTTVHFTTLNFAMSYYFSRLRSRNVHPRISFVLYGSAQRPSLRFRFTTMRMIQIQSDLLMMFPFLRREEGWPRIKVKR